MPKAVLLRNPRALLIPDVAMLLKRAVESIDLVAPGGIDSTAHEFFNYTTDESMFLFIGMEDGSAKGLVMGYFPDSALFPFPLVTLIYNEGTKALLKIMSREIVDHISSHGYSKFWAMNATGRSDGAWMRALLPEGTSGRTIATVLEMAVK